MSTSDETKHEHDKTESEDADLKMLRAKRMLELRKRASSTLAQKKATEEAPKKVSDRDLILSILIERGEEVFLAAEARYPREMAILIPKLAQLVTENKIAAITGGELLQFFRSLGMRVSIATSISVEDHGKFVSLADKLKRQD